MRFSFTFAYFHLSLKTNISCMISADSICSFPNLPVGWIKPDFFVLLLLLLVRVDKEPL